MVEYSIEITERARRDIDEAFGRVDKPELCDKIEIAT